MEYFGFASGSSQTGPTFPYMPETVLNNYPNNLLDHPVVPTAVGFINSYIQTPEAKNLISVVQTWADKSLELLEKPSVQALGIGLSASMCVYGAWRIQKRLRSNIMCKDNSLHFIGPDEPNINGLYIQERQSSGLRESGITDQNSAIIQRQLAETRKKLDEMRFLLNQLEGEKDMLAAEVSMRKKIVAQFQGEIHIERDKRRQAELKMEMMEWENTHLRRLRKDMAVKEGKIDMLEACIKEKDEIHDKLFQENVILPKSVAEARAKEYEILHSKVQKYEMDAVMKRNNEAPYTPARHESVTSELERHPLDDTTATMETALQTQQQDERCSSESFNTHSDWDKSPSSTGSAFPPILYAANLIDKTKTYLCSTNWSNSTVKEQSQTKLKELTCKRKIPRKDNSCKGKGVKGISGQMILSAVPVQQCDKDAEKSLDKSDQLSSPYSRWSLPSTEDGVLDQLKSIFNGLSESESRFTTSEGKSSLMDDFKTPHRIWDLPLKKAADNRCEKDDEDDIDCPSISDDQSSSVFMSASCGSDASDDDTRDAGQSLKNPCARRRSAKRKVSPEKLKSNTRNVSLSKNELRKRSLSKGNTKSSNKELHAENAFPTMQISLTKPKNKLGKQISFDNENKFISVTNPSVDQIKVGLEKSSSYQGRARQKSRLCRSKSKLSANSTLLDNTEPREKTNELNFQIVDLERPHQENCLTVIPLHGPRDKIDRDTYKQLLHYHRTPIPGSHRAAVTNEGNANKNSTYATDTDSEESWIVITPST